MTVRREASVVADGFTLLEAPRWHDGRLWTSDFFSRRVLQFDLDRERMRDVRGVCRVEGRPSGLGFTPGGALRVVSMDDCRLMEVHDGTLEEVADFSDFVAGPANDMAIDGAGTALIGNFGLHPDRSEEALPTDLLRITAGGEIDVAASDVLFPNGIVIDERAGRAFVAETYRTRITVFDYRDGALSNRRVWTEFDSDLGADGAYDIPRITARTDMIPDGIDQDAEGCLWVANAKGHALRVSSDGDVLEYIDTGDLATYSLVLGGSDGRDLYLCSAPPVETFDPSATRLSALLHCRVDVPSATVS